MFYKEFLANLTVLEEIKISNYPERFNEMHLTYILKFLDNCKSSLKILKIDYSDSNESFFLFNNLNTIFPSISMLSNLRELSVKCSFSQIKTNLVDVIKRNENSLTSLRLIESNFQSDFEICEAISNCFNITFLSINCDVAGLEKIFTDSFYKHNSLRQFLLKGDQNKKLSESEFFLNVLSKLKHLRHFCLPNFQMSVEKLSTFCHEMNSLNLNVEYFSLIQVSTEKKDMKYITIVPFKSFFTKKFFHNF